MIKKNKNQEFYLKIYNIPKKQDISMKNKALNYYLKKKENRSIIIYQKLDFSVFTNDLRYLSLESKTK